MRPTIIIDKDTGLAPPAVGQHVTGAAHALFRGECLPAAGGAPIRDAALAGHIEIVIVDGDAFTSLSRDEAGKMQVFRVCRIKYLGLYLQGGKTRAEIP